jgi:type IV pilus assembly protein PilV
MNGTMKTHTPGLKKMRRQRGFSLLEVLVAILVLSLGLLGLAQMQSIGIRSTHGAYLRTQATLLAGGILDSMRANVTVARAGGYNVGLTGTLPGGTVAGPDVAAWKANLAAALPNGNGIITNNGSDVTVKVQWTGIRQNETTGETKIFTVDTTL